MPFSDDQLNDIYDRTSGYCHICHRKLAFSNYGVIGARGAWEVEHSRPQRQGGSSRLCNLYPACISCNRSKGARSTRAVRDQNGVRRAPMSSNKRREARQQRSAAGAVIGGVAGAALFGPLGALAGGALGASFFKSGNPDRW